MPERFTRRDALRAAAAVGLGGVTGLAGCAGAPTGGSSGSDGDPTTASSATSTGSPDDAAGIEETNSVGMSCYSDEDDYFFRPNLIRVEPGATVSFGVGTSCRQQTLAYHPDNDAPLRMPEGAEPWSSPVLQGSMGGTFEVTFGTAGVYDYFGLHEEFGQVGSVVVGSPDPDGQPALEPPQASIPDPARDALSALNDRTREYLSSR